MNILWVHFSQVKYKDFFVDITQLDTQKKIFTPNPEIILACQKDREFLDILHAWEYRVPDGIWIYLAAMIWEEKSKLKRFLKLPIYIYRLLTQKSKLFEKYGDKICWSDLTIDIIYFAIKNNIWITIIDLYNPDDIKKIENQKIFKEKLISKYPELKFDYIIYNPQKYQKIITQIQSSNTKILFSTLWMKKQEISIIEIMKICSNIKLWIWVGSSFDYITWFQTRAPVFLRNMWFEWLYRIFHGPNKLTRLKRIYTATCVFIYHVIKK